MIKVPNYTDLTVTSAGSIVAPAWNGQTGGVVAFRATGTVTINGSISVAGLGYRGGIGRGTSGTQTGDQGESWIGVGTMAFAQREGAGGGGTLTGCGATSGGGGAYGTNGTNGSAGTGGTAYGSIDLSSIFMGAGGGGGAHTCGCTGETGKTGGGIIIGFSDTLIVSPTTGTITADGQTTSDPGCMGDPGGAGAGGGILLTANTLNIGTGRVTSKGGGNSGSTAGTGGDGRIRLNYSTLSGSTLPTHGYNGNF